MLIRKVSAGRGAAWINESIGALKSAGKGFWMPALLIGLLGALPFVSMLQGILILFFYSSLVLCLSNPGGHFNALSGFQNGNFFRILPILLINIGIALIIVLALWTELKVAIEASLQGQQLTEDQALLLIASVLKQMLWMTPILILLHWITMLAIPLATVREQSGTEAIKLAIQATFSNLPALLVNLICLFLLMIIIIVIFFIPIALVGVLFSSSPQLVEIAVVPFTAIMTAMVIAIMSANMLYAYRDIFGDTEAAVTKDTEFLM